MRMRVCLWSALLVTVFTGNAGAGPLEPSAPSQVLQVRTFGTTCPAPGAVALDLRTQTDGSVVFGYALPAKQVAVIREVRFDAAASAGTSVTVFVENDGNYLGYLEGITDAAGRFQGTITFDPGAAIANLSQFCVRTMSGGSIAATATGFLAKDK
jgi:hypothetical protein